MSHFFITLLGWRAKCQTDQTILIRNFLLVCSCLQCHRCLFYNGGLHALIIPWETGQSWKGSRDIPLLWSPQILAASLTQCHKKSSEEGSPLSLKVFVAGRNRLENDGATALAQAFQVQDVQKTFRVWYTRSFPVTKATSCFCMWKTFSLAVWDINQEELQRHDWRHQQG